MAVYFLSAQRHTSDVERERDAVRAVVEPIRAELSRELFAATQLTQGIASLIAIDGGISEKRFAAMAEALIGGGGVIRHLALAPGNVVRYVFPVEGNQPAVGFAYETRPDQWASIERMMKERAIVIAGPVLLVQGGRAVIARTPIYTHDLRASHRYWGLISTVVDFPALLERAHVSQAESQLALSFRGVDGMGEHGSVFQGDPGLFSRTSVIVDVSLPTGSWQIAAAPRNGWTPFRAFESRFFLVNEAVVLVLVLLLFNLLRVGESRATEVQKRRGTEAALRRTNRALRLFSLVKGAVVRAKDEQSLLSEVCRISVESAGYRMAWIGRAENDDGKTVRPLVFAGPGDPFLKNVAVSWGDRPEGQGTAGRAIRSRKPAVERDLLRNPTFRPWHRALVGLDFAAAIAVPLVVRGDVFGVLLIYAAEVDAFDDTEIGLLEDLGSTISYGMENILLSRERDVAFSSLELAHAELEKRVLDRTRELSVAKDAAESADRLKSTFLATMSHELRTPLNSIIGFTGILLQGLAGPLNAEQNKQLRMVQTSARHLLALITDVLDISKIEAGQLVLSVGSFDIRASIATCLQTLRPQAENKGLVLRSEITDGTETVRGDKRRVEQILINLTSNAIKFTDRGEVVVQVVVGEGHITVSVKDTGIGIAEKDLPTLFQPFHQLEVGLARKHEGTGLGLSICRRLVEMMGGTIHVESTLGVGSTFAFTLAQAQS